MRQKLTPQDLVVLLAAPDLNPSILNLDLLKYSGVIPTEWELARPPVYAQKGSQLVFKNGLNLIAEVGQVMLAEPLNKPLQSVVVPTIAQKYVESLPNLAFHAADLSLRGYVPFASVEAARSYVSETLLAPGDWQMEGTRVSLSLAYPSERAPLYLTITEAQLQQKDETTIPIVLFGGRFHYQLQGDTTEEKRNHLQQALNHWQRDVLVYSDLINQKFLSTLEDRLIGNPNSVEMKAVG